INGSFEKLDVDEMVPLPGNTNAAVPYSELTGYELAGRDEYFSGKLGKAFSIKLLLNGIVSEVDRKKEYVNISKSGGDVYLNIQQNQLNYQKQENKQVVAQNVDVDVKQETNVNIDIDIKVELPAIQESFADLKRLLVKQNAGLKEELKELEDSLDNLLPGSPKETMAGPMNKLFRFLKKLGDEESDYGRLIAGAEKGVQYAQKLGSGYNSVAQWLALPQIPEALLK
ncbi:MAG: hypothetical protein GY757_17925, partial [bacterium]|nr:hypothetical protein [bacterium]